VAYEVAKALHAPLDVFIVRKLGVPGHEELAMGAVAPGGLYVVNERLTNALDVSPEQFEDVLRDETTELTRREKAYRGERAPLDVGRKIVIVVDDGLATGASMKAAITALRRHHPKRIVVAVPVCAPQTGAALRNEADELICAEMPERFSAVGSHYVDFHQTSDEEVHSLLEAAAQDRSA
jgi:predicted phosphoribosyltransferase